VALARVRIVGAQGQVKETITNQMGYFAFTNLAGGQSHTISISAKRRTFQNQTISLNSNMTGVAFVATN
jgi:hypothetical protein